MASLVYLDGKVGNPENARVSVFDRGFLFGDGIYETGRSYDRCITYLEEHQARLRKSAAKLRIKVPWSDKELKESLFKLASAFGIPNVYFRTIITRGTIDSVGLDVAESKGPTLVHVVQELSDKTDALRKKGVKILTSRIVRNSVLAQDPNIKTSNYLNSLLALQEVKDRGGEDAILCDIHGNVTEGTTFSVFGVTTSDVVITPSLEVGILDSITRRHVLGIARKFFKVKEGFFKANEFYNCREAFIVSSIREILPVRALDMMEYGVPGPVTSALYERLKEDIRGYVSTHEKF